nr:hypothetical protein [Tanacetum cinerariifolium]
SDAKVVKESHHLSLLLLECVPSHTTVPAAECAIILLPTPVEIVASLSNLRLAKKSKGPSLARVCLTLDTTPEPSLLSKKRKLKKSFESCLERDEGVSTRHVSVPIQPLGKRLGAPASIAVVSASEPSYVGTLTPICTSMRAVVSGHAEKSRAEVMRRQLDPLDSLARCALAHDTKKALDQTITPAQLRRTESLLPLELSKCVNVLSDLLVSHGYEFNSRYTNLVSSKAYLQEKLNQKKSDVRLLRLKVTVLNNKLEKLQRDYDALGQENRELCSQRDAASKEVKKAEVAQFIGSGVEGLVRRLVSSDKFGVALARVVSLGINYGVERGLRMGHTDADFKMVVPKC